ncbi:MAG: glycogen synthase [bacterium]
MRILMVTAEYAPLAKVGGLGDVAASLSDSLAACGHDVRVVMPLYSDLDREVHGIRPLKKAPRFQVRLGAAVQMGSVQVKGSGRTAVKVYLLENEALYGLPGVYGGTGGLSVRDGLQRTVFHNQAALLLPTLLDWTPDIIHCHDAEAALAAVYHRYWYRNVPELGVAGTLLTIHNLAYQDVHPPSAAELIGLPPALSVYPGTLEFHGQLNLLKAGILSAGLVNTVSPTYAREVVADSAQGCQLDGVLRKRGAAFSGILNGADLSTWNPARDPFLPAQYTARNLGGKRQCREALLEELELEAADGPLVGMVTRLVDQKGLDLVLAAVEPMVTAGFTLVVLGTGQENYRQGLLTAVEQYPGRVAFCDVFDEALAHRILAGCDLYLMPSHFEPCGLTQMYALRYGTLPLARKTGGLADTVVDKRQPDGNGFLFDDYKVEALLAALTRARVAWDDDEGWRRSQQRGMAIDFSWDSSAAAYLDLYTSLLSPEAENHE